MPMIKGISIIAQLILVLIVAIPIYFWLQQSKASASAITYSLEQISEEDTQSILQLDLSQQSIKRLPDRLFQLTELKKLSVDGLIAPAIKDSLDKIVASYSYQQHKDSIQIVNYLQHVLGNQIRQIPRQIKALKALESFSIKNNLLTVIPNEIAALKQLKELYLSGNLIRELPANIQELQQLSILHVNQNNIHQLPLTLSLLPKLESLALSNNQLQYFVPINSQSFPSLKHLHLNNNQLSICPKGLESLSTLETLELGYNQLKQLPDSLNQLRNLKWLYLVGNNFSEQEKERIQTALPRTVIAF